MKRLAAIFLTLVMCISLCACGGNNNGGESTTSSTKEDSGFTPNESTGEEKKEAEVTVEIDEENLEQYYDTTKFVGTPTLAFGIYYNINGNADFEAYNLEGRGIGSFDIEVDDRLTDMQKYYCIITDNNTADDTEDDMLAFIFDKAINQ